MRRKDKEIADTNDKISIIQKCKVCRLGLSENNKPYIIPLNYGYSFEDNTLVLFFHSAIEGRKIDIVKANNQACFEIDCDAKIIESENPCDFEYAFRSILGFGKIIFLEDIDKKILGLNMIMKQQTGNDTVYNFSQDALRNVLVYKLLVEEFTGKQKEFHKE